MDNILDIEIGRGTSLDPVKAWTRLLDEHCMGVGCRNAGDDLQCSMKLRPTDSGSVNRARFTRQTLFRTPALSRRDSEETMLLAFVQHGRHLITQGRMEAELDGCGTYILDGSRPFEVDFASDQTVQVAIHVPKAAITKRVGTINELAFGPEAPLQKLLANFAIGLGHTFEKLDVVTSDTLLNQTLDLFALMAAQRKGPTVEPSTHRSGTLVRIKAYINAHLRDDELTIGRTARALGISTRYVGALLAADGTSFGRYLLAKRLEGARREILDPRRINKRITETAYRWGFQNTSHFSRTFRERYGMAPRDAKHSEQ